MLLRAWALRKPINTIRICNITKRLALANVDILKIDFGGDFSLKAWVTIQTP